MNKDFSVYDMPSMLSRRVTKPDVNDPNKWVRDESWYDSVLRKSFVLFKFFQDNGLLKRIVVDQLSDTEKVVLRFSDFTPDGQALIMSQAPDKWDASFDRPGSKKNYEDVSYLVKH